MDTLERLDAGGLKAVVSTYRGALQEHQEALNRLNVYPVPDGDTGTNMALTLESVMAEVEPAQTMREVCAAISHGSLMGARGNSGVILSQILRGVAGAFEAGESGDGSALAAALSEAADAAYGAVMRPVEGTILTVARAAAQAAVAAGGALLDVLEAAKAAGDDALARTPELLPVLAQAGVVDAGGAGYVLLLDAFLAVVDGRGIPAPPAPSGAGPEIHAEVEQVHGEGGGVSGLRYEVMYFLEAPDETIPSFKEVWASIGDSIVVVGGGGIWNCHIHTDDIGASIEAALECGRPKRIRVTDLLDQVDEERWFRDASAAAHDDDETEEHRTPVPCAVVAVATGVGIRRIFRSLGVHQIVAGGQSMNPSTAQILEAVEAAPAVEVVILPNNKNIVPVAEQVAPLTAKVVRVVPTTGIAEGFGALLEFDPHAPADVNLASMTRAAGRVVSGEVTRAVRDSTVDAGPVREGDFLGLVGSRIEVVRPTLTDAALALLEIIVGDDAEIVTIIEGDGASAAVTRHLTEWLAENHPDASAEIHHGGQPLYPYLFSVE